MFQINCKKFFCYFNFILTFSVCAQPPVQDIQGIHANTWPHLQESSPMLEGIALLNSGFLERIRFLSNLGPGKATTWMHPAIKANMEKEKASMMAVLKKYNCTDTLAAYHEIRKRLDVCEDEMWVIADDDIFNDRLKELSFEMDGLSDEIDKVWRQFDDVPGDPIIGWIQLLFPSPNYLFLVSNQRQYDPIGDLMREKDLTAANALVQLILDYKENPIEEHLFLGRTQALFDAFLDKAVKKQIPMPRKKYPNKQKEDYQKLSLFVGKVLVNALKEEIISANRYYPQKQIYPDNIVLTSLLAFIWDQSQSARPLKNLSAIFSPSIAIEPDHPWDFDFYKTAKTAVLENKLTPSLELLTFLCTGDNVYDQLVPRPIPYKGNIRGKTTGTFYDCGETSLRQFFWIVFKQHDHFNFQKLHEFEEKLYNPQSYEPYKKMKEYFEKYSSYSTATQVDAHSDWADVVSNFNKGCPQGRKITYLNNNAYEIDAGLDSMVNVIAQLIPDPILQQTSDAPNLDLTGEKLTRLCELLSVPEFKLSWKDSESDFENRPTSQETTLTFYINDIKAFQWYMGLTHYEITPIERENPVTWKNNIHLPVVRPVADVYYEWCDIFHPRRNHMILPPGFLYNRNNLKHIDGLVFANYVLDIKYANARTYYPILGRLLTKNMLIEDEYVCRNLCALINRYQDHEFFHGYFQASLSPVENCILNTMQLAINLKKKHPEKSLYRYLETASLDPQVATDHIFLLAIKNQYNTLLKKLMRKYPPNQGILDKAFSKLCRKENPNPETMQILLDQGANYPIDVITALDTPTSAGRNNLSCKT